MPERAFANVYLGRSWEDLKSAKSSSFSWIQSCQESVWLGAEEITPEIIKLHFTILLHATSPVCVCMRSRNADTLSSIKDIWIQNNANNLNFNCTFPKIMIENHLNSSDLRI